MYIGCIVGILMVVYNSMVTENKILALVKHKVSERETLVYEKAVSKNIVKSILE